MCADLRANGDWVQVDASAPFTDRLGIPREPGCSGAPQPMLVDGNVIIGQAPTEFSFFYRSGNSNKLLLAFDGGGACWNALTCVGTAINGDPIYDTFVNETPASLAANAGLGDRDNPENPVGDWFQVFIPYCTGDLHTGSNNRLYVLPTPQGPLPALIHHRGYDNFVAVQEWLIDYYQSRGKAPGRVTIVGASAGGYGAQFTYPAMDAVLPSSTRIRVLNDSANGIINQSFYDRALAPGGAWGIWNNMPPQLAGAFGGDPQALPTAVNQSLAWHYPRTRFGQYTRAFDAVQIFYLNVAKNPDNPTLWTDPLQLLFSGLEWTARARSSMLVSTLTTFNYRFYLARGAGHTVIADSSVYSEQSAGDIRLIDWIDDMIYRTFPFGGDWRDASCSPNCLP
jgi:hypothetical protein